MSVKTAVARAKADQQTKHRARTNSMIKNYYQVTADLKPYRVSQLKRMDKNSFPIVEFLYSKMREGNLKPASRASTIDRLCQLSLYHNNKPFKEITQEDIFTYLDTIRKTENEDPLHKWIGTYNISVIKIISFFRWFYQPTLHSNDRSTPEFLNNLRCIKRKEKTTISAEDAMDNRRGRLISQVLP